MRRASHFRRISISSGLLALGAGCSLPFFASGVPAGTLVGKVLWNGEPAAGKVLELQRLTGGGWTSLDPVATGSTAADGTISFQGLPSGTYRLHYASSQPQIEQPGEPAYNELSTWDTQGAAIGSSGGSLPAFDLAFDGLIYPADNGTTIQTATGSVVPFHWSMQPSAQHYQVKIFPSIAGSNAFSSTPAYTSPWEDDPAWSFADQPPPGIYAWQVFIDGGGSGVGSSAMREVGF